MTYILYNPLSNGGHGSRGIEKVQAAFRDEAPETVDLTTLELRPFFDGLTAEDKVVLCGGDGTIHRLVNELEGQPPAVPVYIWRFGRGNDFLRDIADKDEDRILLNDHMKNLPTVLLPDGTHRFLNGCSLGVDAVVCGMMNGSSRQAKKSGYIYNALRAFFKEYKPVNGRVTVDGETREYKNIWMAGTMHGHYQGGGMNFAPDQDRNGTWLCSMVWHGTTPLGTLLRFPFLLFGTHTRFKDVCDIRFGHEITVELDAPTMIQMDGEVIDSIRSYTARKE